MTPRAFAAVAAVFLLCAGPARASDKAAARKQYDAARELLLGGEFRDALTAINESIASYSKFGPAYAVRARLWHITGDAARQKQDAERALDLIGGGRLDADELAAQGGAFLLTARPRKALAAFEAAAAASHQAPEALVGRARAWRELGEPDKAAADLDAALKSDPKPPLWLYERARASYEKGDDAKTLADLTAALKVNKKFAIGFGLLGAALARKGDYARALKAYDRAALIDPEYAFAPLGRAAVYLHQGREEEAMKEFAAAVRANGADYAPYFNRAEAHWRGGRREQALTDYRAALAAPTLAADAALSIGDRYMALQLWRDAIDADTRAYEIGSKPAASLARRARAWEAAKEPKRALSDLNEAVRLAPDAAVIVAQRGSLESRLNMDRQAQEDLVRAVRLEPKNADILVARASFYARQGKSQLALEDYDAAVASDPNSAEAYNGRGALRANAFADLEKALVDVRKAVDLQPRDPGYHFNYGMLRLKSRLYVKAIESFTASLELKGPAARVLQQRAEAKFQLGDHVGAKLDVESALEKDPRNASIYVTLGSMRLRARDYEQAVRDLSQALHIDGGLASAYAQRGIAYGAMGQNRSAMSDLKEAVDLDSHSKEAWTALCQLRRITKDPRGALTACDKALGLDPQYAPAYLQRGLTLLDLHQYPRVIEDADSAWQLGVRRGELLIAKSIAQAGTRQYKQSHATYLRALVLDPSVHSPYLGFSAGHPEGADYLTAIVDLDPVLQKDDRDPYVYVLRADALHSAEQYEKAVLEYTKAMELDGTLSDAYVGRGVALTGQDALEAAQQDFVRAIELQPDAADPRVRLAMVLTMRRNYKAALTEVGKALQIDPKSSEAYLRAGNAHYFLKDHAKAVENYALAVRSDPFDPNALNGLGLGAFAQRDFNEALEAFSRAIVMNPASDRYYRNRASVWTASQKFGNAAGDFRTASLVNTDPSLVDEYRKLVEEAEARSAAGATKPAS